MYYKTIAGDCLTCERSNKRGKIRCAVLTEMIGRTKKCWAHTKDPNWYLEAQIAGEAYEKQQKSRRITK